MSHRMHLHQGDITQFPCDAIVNAANSSLLGGGGVDGAIHRAGGPEILAACREIRAHQGRCATGEAVITTAGRLPAKKVIHTVGPIWSASNPGQMEQLLANCYQNSLQLAVEHQLKAIAFPNISTGVYRFPKQRAARVATQAVMDFLEQDDFIESVTFVCFDKENFLLYQDLLP